MSPEKIGEELAGVAESIFKDKGSVVPAMFFFRDDGNNVLQLMLSSLATEDFQNAVAVLSLTFCSIVDAAYVVLISEAWKHVTDDRRPMEEVEKDYPRGRLQNMADAGDTTVHTVVMVQVFSVADAGDSWSMFIDTDDGFSRHTMKGRMDGGLPDAFYAAMAQLPDARATLPAGLGVREAVESLAPFIEVATMPEEGGPEQLS